MNSLKRTFGFINAHPLAGKHLFSAYLRFIKWQIQARLKGGRHTVKWLGDLKVYAQKGSTGITGNFYTGLHEFEEMGFLLHYLDEGDIFFDVGANVGSYTLLAGGLKGSTCLSFEPAPETFIKLMDNIILNGLSERVSCLRAVVGACSGSVNFTQNEDTTNHVVKDVQNLINTIAVPVIKLDDYSYMEPALIKIDVEGFETEVINGSQDLLLQPSLKAIIIELNGSGERYGYKDEAIHLKLIDSGFEPFHYEPFKRKLHSLSSYGKFNTIYIRDIGQVSEKLRKAPAFIVFGEQI